MLFVMNHETVLQKTCMRIYSHGLFVVLRIFDASITALCQHAVKACNFISPLVTGILSPHTIFSNVSEFL